ncbi:MAG: TPM domain-containing protein [Erythrobacter sp.]
MDAAEILTPQFEDQLTTRLAELEAETKVQLVVAATPDLKGHDISDYSFELANAWGIGSKERNDGLMVLVAPKERKVRIEVGLGLEASVKDEEAAKIVEEAIIPAFQNGDFEKGISRGVDRLIIEVSPAQLKEAA